MADRSLVLLMIGALLIAGLAPIAVAQGPPDDQGQPDDPESQGDADDRGQEGQARAERGRMMGQLSYENGTADGAFIHFEFDEDDGTLSNWSYMDDPVIESIDWDRFHVERVFAHGSVFQASSAALQDDTTQNTSSASSSHNDTPANESGEQGNETEGDEHDDGNETDRDDRNETEMDDEGNETEMDDEDDEAERNRIRAHDNPTGFIKLEVRSNNTVTWTFADDVNVSQLDNWTVEITTDGIHAILWKDHDANQSGFEVDGQTVTLDVSKANVMFRVSPVGPIGGGDGYDGAPDEEARERGRAIGRAAAQGQVGAEIRIGAPDDAGQAATDVSAYDDINVSSKADQGRVDLRLSFDGPAKTIVIDIDRDLLNVSSAADVEVTFDNETIDPADDLQDVLDPSDEDAPEFLLVVGADGVQALISVPNWSPHTVSIQEAGQAETPSLPAPGLVAIIVAAAAGVAIAAKRRKD